MTNKIIITTIMLLCTIIRADDKNIFSNYREETELAVENGLKYLIAVQHPDGNFPGNYGDSTGIVSLVGMSFLSKGYSPDTGKYSTFLQQCIKFVINSQRKNGLLATEDSRNEVMYSHNISTLFLSEVNGMVPENLQKQISETLPKAIRLILASQQVKKEPKYQGGWRYFPNSKDSDLSCSGWALMALRSAKLNGAPIPDNAIESAISYILKNSNFDTGTFGYMDNRTHNKTLTGAGLLSLEIAGMHGHEISKKSGDYILTVFSIPMNWQYYGNYYNSQAMFQLGGKYWEKFANWYYPKYLNMQQPNGSWHSNMVSDVYATAMTILALTVPYRQLPIYQRDETVSK